MSFTRSILTLSLMTAFAIHSPLLIASNAYNNPTNSDNDEFSDDFDDSLEDFYGDEEFVSIATGTKKINSFSSFCYNCYYRSRYQKYGG
jgi:hypothetical protein